MKLKYNLNIRYIKLILIKGGSVCIIKSLYSIINEGLYLRI